MRTIIASLFTCLIIASPLAAAELPAAVTAASAEPLERVGSGTYRKLGMSIYKASLWAPDAHYDKREPYALKLTYLMDLSKDTVVDAVVTDIRAQQMADDATMDQWEKQLTRVLPAVGEGDEIIGVSIPGKPSKLYFNGKQIASISDHRLSESFFNIWLGNVANPSLRKQLLGSS